MPLPCATFLGEDAAGTAYGITTDKPRSSDLVRCPRASDACDSVAMPLNVNDSILVDPSSTGLLSSSVNSTDAERHLAVSRDGGATWLQGASSGPTARATARSQARSPARSMSSATRSRCHSTGA